MFQITPQSALTELYRTGENSDQIFDTSFTEGMLKQRAYLDNQNKVAEQKRKATVDKIVGQMAPKIGLIHNSDQDEFRQRIAAWNNHVKDAHDPSTGQISPEDLVDIKAEQRQIESDALLSANRVKQEQQEIAKTENGNYRPREAKAALEAAKQASNGNYTSRVQIDPIHPIDEFVDKRANAYGYQIKQNRSQNGSYSNTKQEAEAEVKKLADEPHNHIELYKKLEDKRLEGDLDNHLAGLDQRYAKDVFVKDENGKPKLDAQGNPIYNIDAYAKALYTKKFEINATPREHVGYVGSGSGARKPETLANVVHTINPETGEGDVKISPPIGKKEDITAYPITRFNPLTKRNETQNIILTSYTHNKDGEIIGGKAVTVSSKEDEDAYPADKIEHKDQLLALNQWNKNLVNATKNMDEEELAKWKQDNPPPHVSTLKSPPKKEITITGTEAAAAAHNQFGVNPYEISNEEPASNGIKGNANYQRYGKPNVEKQKVEINLTEVHPKTKAEWDSAPKGSFYIDQNNKKHVK